MQRGGQQTRVVQEFCRLCRNNGTLVCLGSAEPKRGPQEAPPRVHSIRFLALYS